MPTFKNKLFSFGFGIASLPYSGKSQHKSVFDKMIVAFLLYLGAFISIFIKSFIYFDTVCPPNTTMRRAAVFCVFNKKELVRNIRGILLFFGFNNSFCATKDVFVAHNEKSDT